MRLIDADALIEFCAERWIPLNIDAVNMQPTIQPEKEQLSCEGTTFDTISRQAAIDTVDSEVVSTNPEHFKSSEKFIKFMDDADIASFGKWQWANGFNTALVASKVKLEKLPTSQPEPQWIPVSERLPDDLSEVNVTWVNHNPELYYEFTKDKPFTATAVYYKGEWYWYSATCVDYLAEYGRCDWNKVDDVIEIVAWMPLPEAYKPNK